MSADRNTIFALSTSIFVFVGGAALLWMLWPEVGSSAQVELGQRLYAVRCASCHGASLQGEADWQTPNPSGRMPAPPHDASGHTWHHSDQELFRITKFGMSAVVPDYESGMPAFGNILSDREIEAILAFIKSTWPEREREYQRERSRSR